MGRLLRFAFFAGGLAAFGAELHGIMGAAIGGFLGSLIAARK